MTIAGAYTKRYGGAAPVVLLLVAPVVAFFGGGGLYLNLLREQLHLQCSFLRMGESDPGAFYCADGISYIAPGVAFFGLLVVGSWISLLLLGLTRTPRAAGQLLALLSLGPLVLVSCSAWIAADRQQLDALPDADYWAPVMFTATVLMGCAVLLVGLYCLAPAGPLRLGAWGGAVGVVIAAAIVQPGICAAAIVSCVVLLAALIASTGPQLEAVYATEEKQTSP